MKPQQKQSLSAEHICDIVNATIQSGGAAFALDICQLLQPRDLWEFPKYPARTTILPPEVDLAYEVRMFVSRNEDLLREPDCWLGVWTHPQTHDFYLDITTGCTDLDDARRMALDVSQRHGRRIVAIYNSRRKQTVYL